MTTDLKQLWMEAFGDPEKFVDGFFSTGFSPDRYRRLYADDRLVCALYWFDVYADGKKLAYIYAVATAESMRGRGYCRRLMQHTHRQLKRCGYSGAVLVPGSQSLFGFYEKLGYKTCCSIKEFHSTASGSADLRQLELQEYARLRRQMLPKGALVQEGASLRFLNTYCRFWAGEDWLLAGSVQKDTLYVQEFLGDPALAPAITAALGAEKGCFRTPGAEKDFAMYYSLDGTPAPRYFGLAMD